jgi:predicted molibdopterin-dependent oxidoreductase YjgC
MFKRLADAPEATVTVDIEGREIRVPAGDSVAAAVLAAGLGHTRTTPVSGRPRAPYCMMGLCFDCLMEIDGQANRQACLVRVADGMRIRRQHRAGEPATPLVASAATTDPGR